jgi:hypothetical protein
MRTFIRVVAALALAACAPGRVIVVHRPAPPPPPPPPRIEPLELAVARPVRGHLLVQTSRPAYVAIFEIVPDRGVALIAPAYVHQRTWMLAGLNWVPVSWKVQSTMYYGPPSAHGVPGRYVYAIASDEPLQFREEVFRPGYLQRALGPTVYRSRNPYVTMRALSRLFVPPVVDEAWAEDAYVLAATYASDPYRTVRIYCANRSVYEVPEELADRAWCPVTQRNTGGGTAARPAPSRPDSVVAGNGLRVRRRVPETRTVYRVREPATTPGGPVTDPVRGNPPTSNSTGNNGTNSANSSGNKAGNANDAAANDSSRARRGGGNAYGHTDDQNVRGRGIENEKQQRQTPPPPNDKGRGRDKELDAQKDAPPSSVGNDPRREPRVDEKPANQHERPNEHKPDEKRVEPRQQEQRQEQKQEEKQADKAAERPEHKQPDKAADRQPPRQDNAQPVETPRESKPDAKPEKPEPGAQPPQAEKQEAKPDKPDAKPEPKSEGDVKGQGKPDNKPNVKEPKGQQTGPEEPGKKDQKGKP